MQNKMNSVSKNRDMQDKSSTKAKFLEAQRSSGYQDAPPPTPPTPPLPPPPPPPPVLSMDHQLTTNQGFAEDKGENMKNTRDIRRMLTFSSASGETVHTLSGLYAQLLVVATAILVFTEVLHGPIPLLYFHGYIFTYLVGGAIVCLVGAYISMVVDKLPGLGGTLKGNDVESDSPYNQSRHSLFATDTGIYLRIGALVFGLGTLISSGLEIASIFTMQENCMDELNLAQPVLRGLFTFLQMHFLFMNAQEIVKSLGWFRHVALMHLMATNITIWIRLVLWESSKDWLEANHIVYNSSTTSNRFPPKDFNYTVHSLETNGDHHTVHHRVYYTSNCWWHNPQEEEIEGIIFLNLCLKNSTIGAIWEKAMPYLYSFIIQYCLVAAGVIYIVWGNLYSRRNKHNRQMSTMSQYGEDPKRRGAKMGCQSSSRGLFLGLLVLVGGIIVLILYFVLANDEDFLDDMLFAIVATRCTILIIAGLSAVLGLIQIRQMRSKTSRRRRLNDLLQRIGLLAVYAYGMCSMIVGGVHIYDSQHLALFMDGIFMVLQACVQSLFIHQIIKKRCSPSNEIDQSRPGRQVVIFLVFCNLVLWVVESFTAQNNVASQLQLQFYGTITWSLITRIILPLVIFYRFHSVVALLEAWKKSYKIKRN